MPSILSLVGTKGLISIQVINLKTLNPLETKIFCGTIYKEWHFSQYLILFEDPSTVESV